MNNLNAVLGIELNNISIFDITEENLIAFKSEDYYTQSNFYFWLINEMNKFESKGDLDKIAYCHYLLSYFIFIILTPINYESLAFYHIKKAVAIKPTIKYKEWLLIFATLPNGFINTYDALNLAEEIIENNSESLLANTVLQMY